jgi:multidrug efflux system outer membrane protein
MKFIKHIVALPLALLVLGFGSCGNYKAVTIKSQVALPDTFKLVTDTATVATTPVHSFFTDKFLLTLIDSAMAHYPDMLSAYQRLQVAEAQLQYNKSLRLPTVNLNLNAGAERFGDYTMNGVGNYDTNLSPNINSDQRVPTSPTPDYFVGFRAAWEVDIWGKLKNQQKAALARYLATQQGYQWVKTALVANIATQYYQLLALDIELSVIQKNIKYQENALDIVKIQKLGGRATELAVQQFAAQLANTRALYHSTTQQIVEAQNQLSFLTGDFSKTISRDTSIMALRLPVQLQTGIPAQMLLNRPDIRQAEYELLGMNADTRSARAAFFPTLTLTPYAGYNAFKTALLFNPGSAVFGIIGGLTAPVLNRKRIKADYNTKLAEAKIALSNYQKAALSGYKEVMDNLNGMQNYAQYYQQKQQEVTALQNAVSVANDLYLVGRASYLEVITAQRNVLDAELQLAVSKKDIYLSEVNLYRALGGGWR